VTDPRSARASSAVDTPVAAQEPLTGLARLVRANGYRKTRFHNARGEMMPPRAWLDAPVCLARRLLGRATTSGPWMNPVAIRWLDDAIDAEWSVLELGAGSSTEWLSSRVSHVLSLEDDPSWAAEVRRRLDQAGIENCELRHKELSEFQEAIESLPAHAFDLVIVDSNESAHLTRLDFLAMAKDRVKEGGYLLLDDSDNPPYWSADAHLRGWPVVRLTGMKPFPLMAAETSVYRRPLGG
jgi:Methyltransferase domain